jgi:predicted RNA-binding Zn-ribbon protein involved in translation (DUF1610 family)
MKKGVSKSAPVVFFIDKPDVPTGPSPEHTLQTTGATRSSRQPGARGEVTMSCTSVRCPRCGDPNVAVSNRSDGIDSYRCDKCGHQWQTPAASAPNADELPPLPAIDATGG